MALIGYDGFDSYSSTQFLLRSGMLYNQDGHGVQLLDDLAAAQ